jgi:mannose PTS system EIIC component
MPDLLPAWGPFLLLVLWGGWVGLDTTSVGQFMISRPIVAATLTGWFLGDPATGALLGVILEAMNLTVLPVGAATYPESGPAAVAAAAVLVAAPDTPAAMLTAVLFALCWAWVGGASVRLLRLVNVRLVTLPAEETDVAGRTEWRHLQAVAYDYVRGAALVAVGMPVLAVLLRLSSAAWPAQDRFTSVVLWGLAAAGIAATLRLFGGRRFTLFAIGLGGGLLFVNLT